MRRRTWLVLGFFAIPMSVALGIALGILFPDIWPFTAAASTAAVSRADPPAPAAGKTAEQLAREWIYLPKPLPPNHGSASSGARKRAFVDIWIRDNGKGKEWFEHAVTFYVEKCGSDVNPIARQPRVVGHNGVSKGGGRYVITEPGVLTMPLNQIPARPQELLFAYDETSSSVTVTIRRQGDDVVTILVTAAVR